MEWIPKNLSEYNFTSRRMEYQVTNENMIPIRSQGDLIRTDLGVFLQYAWFKRVLFRLNRAAPVKADITVFRWGWITQSSSAGDFCFDLVRGKSQVMPRSVWTTSGIKAGSPVTPIKFVCPQRESHYYSLFAGCVIKIEKSINMILSTVMGTLDFPSTSVSKLWAYIRQWERLCRFPLNQHIHGAFPWNKETNHYKYKTFMYTYILLQYTLIINEERNGRKWLSNY